MAQREIELLGSEVLRTPAPEVEDFGEELRTLVDDMFETMYAAEGAGLAAPQVGVSRRVLVLDIPDEVGGGRTRMALVNPRIVERSERTDREPEGCLSIPGVSEVVQRPDAVTVEGFDPHGKPVRHEAEGFLARVLQHEIDHLDGVLFIDRLSPLKRKLLMRKYRKVQGEAAKEAS